MTKHDSWVKFIPGNPFEPILDLFADAMIPVRDPFPLELAGEDNHPVLLVDLERLSSVQTQAIAQVIARRAGVTANEVAAEALAKDGFAISYEWIESMMCGPEGFQRGKELADFLERTQTPSTAAWREFYNDQHKRWIAGNEEPPPIKAVEDIDPRLRMPGQEEALKRSQINQMLNEYSVFDVLTGRAMVDILNKIDPENAYSLVGFDDDWEWEEYDDDD